MSFKKNLYLAREGRRMTQEKLANALGVSRQTVTRWESGELPGIYNLILLANTLKTPIERLLKGEIVENTEGQTIELQVFAKDLVLGSKYGITKSDVEAAYKSCFHEDFDTLQYLSTGYNNLDLILGGLRKEGVYCLSGDRCVGKNSFLLSIATNIVKESQKSVLFFSLSNSKTELLKELFALEMNIERTERNQQQEEFKLDFIKAANEFRDINLSIIDKSNLAVDDIENYCRYSLRDISCIVIDDFDSIKQSGNYNNKRNSNLSVYRQLRELASAFHCPILVISQLNRNECLEDEGFRPENYFAQDAYILEEVDALMYLYRESYYDIDCKNNDYELIVTSGDKSKIKFGTKSVNFTRDGKSVGYYREKVS